METIGDFDPWPVREADEIHRWNGPRSTGKQHGRT